MSTERISDQESIDVEPRTRKALEQYMTVLEDQGRVRGRDGQYLVVSESGREYLVDARLGTCECPDHEYRGVRCKHIRRVEFATGHHEVPPGVDVAGNLGEHVSGTTSQSQSQAVATDGGVAVESSSSSRSGPRPDYIFIGTDTIGADHLYRTVDEHVLVIEDGDLVQDYDLEEIGKEVNDWIDYVEAKRDGFEVQHLYKDLGGAVGGAI